LPPRIAGHALTLTARSDGRVFFVMPFEGRTLVGTTDRDFHGDPGDPQAEERDVTWLLDEANAALDGPPFRREDVLSVTCGVRTLLHDPAERPSAVSREQRVFEEPDGVVHVVGGKLTTWRAVARTLVERAARTVGKPLDDGRAGRTTPLPGGGATAPDAAAALARASGLDLATAERLVARYGSRAPDVLAPARDDPSLLEPVGPTVPELRAELAWLRDAEFAETVDDALRRRLPRLLIDRPAPADLARADALLRGQRASESAGDATGDGASRR
ncbi:MAG TPA: FAD-dependent oxidoreductase, partial [Planctomycetota bacterium]|nr:FAD-dependent oxidoreductase [Planctomycetota bacterium]